ncbi:Levodione reductase [Pseudocercospora fuligena]|uniref:Levodione reductase n=1 Tax=Pseudocercospora fuligena TaxID=685502 RepID=A0A8H6RG70_9PEZI|nr:Levodione reductase [Pseudocercospora fuligena]
MAFPGVTIVVGAASGIGRATARLFVKRGCTKIVLGDVNSTGLKDTKQQLLEIEPKADVAEESCDVTSESSVETFFSKAVSRFGRIDHAANVAGVLMPGTSPVFSAKDFDTQFSINARGMWLCQRAEIVQMLKQEPIQQADSPSPIRGTIANVASMAALRVYDNLPSYCASKFAILGFTKSDAMRYGAEHIRINAVCPGVIKTPMLGEVRDDDTTNIAEMTKEMALGRQGRPEEVAEGLFWLSSPQSSFVTGIALPINGGMVGA